MLPPNVPTLLTGAAKHGASCVRGSTAEHSSLLITRVWFPLTTSQPKTLNFCHHAAACTATILEAVDEAALEYEGEESDDEGDAAGGGGQPASEGAASAAAAAAASAAAAAAAMPPPPPPPQAFPPPPPPQLRSVVVLADDAGGSRASSGAGAGGSGSGRGGGSLQFDALDIPQAFSHFTHWATRQKLLVCDLQGVLEEDGTPPVFRLTDPAISYKSNTGRARVFGRSDRGPKGINAFFRTHVCTEVCKLVQTIAPEPPKLDVLLGDGEGAEGTAGAKRLVSSALFGALTGAGAGDGSNKRARLG